MPSLNHEFNTTSQVLLVPVNFQNNFSCLSKVSDLNAALPCEQGCPAILHSTRTWVAGLGIPAGSLSKSKTGFQWQIQASLTFWKMVFVCLLFLPTSSAKSINKACYSSLRGAATASSFSFHPSFPTRMPWVQHNGRPSEGRTEGPPPPPAIPAGTFPRPRDQEVPKERAMLTHWPL